MEIDGLTALQNLDREDHRARFPDQADPRCRENAIFPVFEPSFSLERGCRVFTIGSCFARNIEEHLDGYDLPTLRFSVSERGTSWLRNALLNEYNPGSMLQRVEWAFAGEPAPQLFVAKPTNRILDLLLPRARPVSLERAVQRHKEIDAVYRELPSADVVVVTLGLIEAWFDSQTGYWLNRMPPRPALHREPGRYRLRVMDVDEAYPMLEKALNILTAGGRKVVLSVSPVPLSASFSGQDVVVANSYSKAVLRVCAQRLAATMPDVDYFPSYEIVMSGGLGNFIEDNVHVSDDLVAEIVRSMLERYEAGAARTRSHVPSDASVRTETTSPSSSR